MSLTVYEKEKLLPELAGKTVVAFIDEFKLGFISFNYEQCPFVSDQLWFGSVAECSYINEERFKNIYYDHKNLKPFEPHPKDHQSEEQHACQRGTQIQYSPVQACSCKFPIESDYMQAQHHATVAALDDRSRCEPP